MAGTAPPRPHSPAFLTARPVLAAWLLLGAVTTLPYVAAAVSPPPGRTFVGTFHWIDDFYNYVSFVQQAEDGRFLFKNKLRLDDHAPVLVNLEWWTVGTLSRICGRRPFLAYRLFALAVLGTFLWAVDRTLRRGGLPKSHRLFALIFVGTAGGLGGLLFELTPRPVFRSADLASGIFPFKEILANPHWLAGTWLLLETLLAFDGASSFRGALRPAALGTALGLVRPYDLVMVVLVRVLSVPFLAPSPEWPRRLFPLLGLGPVVLYNYWVFYAIPTFSTYAGTRYYVPPPSDFLWALGPAGLAALSALRRRQGNEATRAVIPLWTWSILALVAILLRPVAFAPQFVIGAGLPLLLLASLGTARARPWALGALLASFCTTAIVALLIVWQSDPNWHVAAERREAALALRPHCRPGEIAFSPEDIGLYTIGLTSCHAFLSHRWEPDHSERQALVRAFYGEMPVEERAALLRRFQVTKLVLPGDAGPSPRAWLGEGTDFAQVALLGPPPGTLSVYVRR